MRFLVVWRGQTGDVRWFREGDEGCRRHGGGDEYGSEADGVIIGTNWSISSKEPARTFGYMLVSSSVYKARLFGVEVENLGFKRTEVCRTRSMDHSTMNLHMRLRDVHTLKYIWQRTITFC